ncbi:MAG: hypothetical protein H7Y07_02415 [Pyrinomonadaceae bacterium]|nr:hypothetical protein [Sphingobacteriaceae bacterium]
MNSVFLQHQWIAFWRSKNTGKSMIVNIIMGLGVLYLFANLLIASFFLDKILSRIFPDREVIEAFNGILLYYFLFDLLLRFQFQELPTLGVRPYLNLPIKRRKIVRYLSLTSLWSAFNVSPFLLMVPFLIKILLFEGEILSFFGFIFSIAGLTLFNHFFSLWIKRKINLNVWIMVAFLSSLTIIILSDFYLNSISISSLSRYLFNKIAASPHLSIIVVLLGAIMYYLHRQFLLSNLYIDDLHKKRAVRKSFTDIPFLGRFGLPGELAVLELKLIFRNKRPRSTVTMSLVFLFYGLLFYRRADDDGMMLILAGMMITGLSLIQYGQFMFSWQSAHFDGILAQKISAQDFFKSKFVLFSLFSTISFLLTIPYVYFGWKILLIHTMLSLWNIGVSSLILLAFANWNYKYIDLSKGSTLNYQGVGASQFILGIPLLMAPIIIFWVSKWLFNPIVAILLLGFIGLVFILSRQYWLNILVNSFKSKRYTIAEGFRNH